MALEAGNRVADYEILGLLGTGGMGHVYKVRNVISNREEAMKILRPDLTSDPDLAARFMAEIRTVAALEHPNIAQLRTAFQFQDQFVMVMELVEGVGLDKLPAQTRITLEQIVDYAIQALAALSFAHGRGVIHRDIKPANLMITTHGQVKLMDFGIAKSTDDMQLTRPGSTMGSLYYMSPEQVRGGAIDARSDIYSFGVTLYELLTGRKPFEADTSYSVLNAQLNQEPTPPITVNPSLPVELNSIVLRAMAKAPEARFQTAAEFREAFKSLSQSAVAAAAPAVAASAAVASPAPSVGLPPPPPFAPVAGPNPPQTPPPGYKPSPVPAAVRPAKSHRGLWIGLGALAAVLALAAAVTFLPSMLPSYVFGKSATALTSAAPVTAPVVAVTPAQTADAALNPSGAAVNQALPPTASAQNNGSYPALPKPSQSANPSNRSAVLGNSQQASSSYRAESYNPPPPSGPSPAEVRKAHDELVDLQVRADADRSGVQHIRSEQQAMGLDLRGDILASMGRMNSNLKEAQIALGQKDINTAQEYMSRAEHDLETLDKFLGR